MHCATDIYIYIYMVCRSFLSYAPPNAGHSGFRMYAILIQQVVNLHRGYAKRGLRLQRRRDQDRIRCQSQPQLNSRAALSVQEQPGSYPCNEGVILIADSVESRLLEMSACQHSLVPRPFGLGTRLVSTVRDKP